ncbi:uncharacterized protein LOC142326303 [Lycorma delicatula]|uniref:uncharacterized protein LOC142326303 n=1 Tax=Lycorma delicatula TaxID=130591 RepID=UPI003F5136D1
MDAVCKAEEDEMEAAAATAALDEWPPPAASTDVDVSDDRKDNSSRLLFLVEYVGEPENAPFTNGGEQFICDIDPQVVNPLDPNMGCVACYSPVEYTIANNTDNGSRPGTPYQSNIGVASSTGNVSDTSTDVVTTNVAVIDNKSTESGSESSLNNINITKCANNEFSISSTQSLASPLSAPPGTPSSPLSALTQSQSPMRSDDGTSILIIENQFSLGTLDGVTENNYIMTTSSGFQNSCNSELTHTVNATVNPTTTATISTGTNGRINPNTLALNSTDKLLIPSDNIEQPSPMVMSSTENEKDQTTSGSRQVELLLENGITLGFVDQDSRVIQIPREYIMAAKLPPFEEATNEDTYLKNLCSAFKSQGLLVDPNEENNEIRLVSFLDADHESGMDNLINQALVVDEPEPAPMAPSLALPPATQPVQQKEITLKDFSNQDWMNGYESKTKWCQECSSAMDGDCSMHRVNGIITDKPVPSRARATLPASYLAINWLSTSVESATPVYGVFARKTIPNRTQFGPIEGVLVKSEDPNVVIDSPLEFLVETESGEMRRLDVSNENTSNWMRFVRPAKNIKEQNLILSQQGHSLYFTSIRPIHPRQELLVWYSPPYAAKRNLHTLEPDKNQCETVWPCFECEEKFKSSEELQKHLNTHDIERDEKNDGMKTRSKKQAHPILRRKTQPYIPPVKKYRLNDNKSNQEKNQTFECMSCKRSFPRMYSLKRHLQLHNTDKRYPCPHCSFVFTHPYNRDRHVRKQHSNKITTTNTKIVPCAVNTAEQSVEKDIGWLCKHCNLTFSSASVLNLHTLAHAAENIEEPEYITGLPSDFSHIYHDGEFLVENGDIQCPQCTQEFHTKRDLIEHVSAHGQKTDSMQQSETTSVATEDNCIAIATLNATAITTIGDLTEQKSSDVSSDKHRCDYCYKIFTSTDRFQKHVLIHTADEVRPHQCNFCQKRFLSSPALSCHLKTHTLMKSFECPICKMKFEQVLALKAHVHSHAKNGVFTCPHCQKEFEEYSLIRKHIRAFHCDRKFICAYCEKLFHTQDKLRMHMLRHSDHREFLCADCGKQFKRKDKLKEHMKRMHSTERELKSPPKPARPSSAKKFVPKVVVSTSDYEKFIFKCHTCLLGFKRRGMLVNHLANRHPDITPESVPELNLPILKTTRDYYCQYCEKIYKSSSKRKAHILKNHPGAELPMSNRQKGGVPDISGLPNPTFSQTVGSITTTPHGCQWCHKQYASKAKLLQHQRKKHLNLLPSSQQQPRPGKSVNITSESDSGATGVTGASATNNKEITSVMGNSATIPSQQIVSSASMKSAVQQSSTSTAFTVCTLPSAINNTCTTISDSANTPVNTATTSSSALPVTSAVPSTAATKTAGAATVAALPQGQLFTIHPLTNQAVITDSYLSEYEIATGDTDFTEGGIIIDAATLKREMKNGVNDSLQGEAALLMSELGCTLSDIRSLSSQDQQYLKLIQMPASIVISDALNDPFYTPYTAR